MAQRQSKRERQKERRAAQRAAVLAARRRRARRRMLLRVVLVLALAGGIVATVLSLQGDDEEVATQNTTTTALPTTTSSPLPSAAGKPCVPVADALPAGAPAVPVKVGPPPASLVKEDLKPGTGAEVTANSAVTIHYVGVACSTGKIFDSSYARGQPIPFGLSQVVPGFRDGLVGMKVGGQRLLGIPSDLAYGKAGSPTIGPDESLWFVVDLVNVSG